MNPADEPTEGRPEVSIVLITHEHEDDLPACLESLAAAMSPLDAELIFIDNRSVDRSFEIARELAPYPNTLIRNEERMGFSANANQGIRRAKGEAILLLNPDTVIAKDAIGELLTQLRANPEAGILAPALYFPDGSIQPSRRRFPTLRSAISRRSPARRWMRISRSNQSHLMMDRPTDEVHEIDWALAACWLINPAALAEVGLFDEGFRLYVEDIDLAFRMHERGWKVIYVPSARVEHRHHAVTDTDWLTWRTLAHYRGMLRYIRKHGLRLK